MMKVNVNEIAGQARNDNENETGRKNRIKKERREKTQIEEIFLRTSRMNLRIDSKLQEIEHWRAFAAKADVIFSAAGRSGGSGKTGSKIEDCVCKIADIEESLKNDMSELIELKEKAMNMIDKIDVPEYRNLLIQRYLCGKKWEEIAEYMGYSYVHTVARLHPKALESINRIGAES